MTIIIDLLNISFDICVGDMILIAQPMLSLFCSITASNVSLASLVSVFESKKEKSLNFVVEKEVSNFHD